MSYFLRHLDAFLKINNPLPNTLKDGSEGGRAEYSIEKSD